MRRIATVTTLVVTASIGALAGCDSAASAPTPPTGAESSAQPAPTAPQTIAIDSVPRVNAAADQGCVDEPGTLHAPAGDWYPGSTGSPLALNGERATSDGLDAFVASAADALATLAPGFLVSDQWENRRTSEGCATHRYAVFTDGDEEIVVSLWRVESAADPFWVPNEATFEAIDDSALVSRGNHIAIALAVAPDGTTARISAYGARASEIVAGWPSTALPNPSAEVPGPTSLTADELVPIAHAILAGVIDQRPQ